jgi:hypothetical protein
MKPLHMAMAVALAGAAALLVFGDNSPHSDVAEPVTRRVVPAKGFGAPAVNHTEFARTGIVQSPASDAAAPHILRLQPRQELIGAGGAGEGSDVFVSRDWTPPPPPPAPAAAPPPPPPPSAPPLPFTYMGKALENGAWEVYLSRAGKTYIVQAKTVIDGTYRVDAIAPPILTLTYLPLNQVQQLNIGAFD